MYSPPGFIVVPGRRVYSSERRPSSLSGVAWRVAPFLSSGRCMSFLALRPFRTRTGSIKTVRSLSGMKFREWIGKGVFHCHILPHEDTRMMRNFRITESG